jgi:hypothetical protein
VSELRAAANILHRSDSLLQMQHESVKVDANILLKEEKNKLVSWVVVSVLTVYYKYI